MEIQPFNEHGKIYKYTSLDEIMRLNIPESLKEGFKEKYKKRVYYNRKENCYIGTLVGLEVNEQLCDLFYMIFSGNKIRYVSCNQSITLLE